MGVKVNHRDSAPANGVGQRRDVRQRDGVIPTQDDREDARFGDDPHSFFEPLEGGFSVTGGHLDITEVNNAEVLQRIDAEGQRRT